MKWLLSALNALAKYKDGIAVVAGLFLGAIGLFQYLEYRSDQEISEALKLLERREKGEVQKAIVAFEELWRPLLADGGINEAAASKAATLMIGVPKHENMLTTLSFYYNSVSSCALESICDRTILCSSLLGTVQDYLKRNRHYFASLRRKSPQAATRLYLSLPEFAEMCIDNLSLYVFAQHDSSFWCQTGLYLERLIGVGRNAWCKPAASDYDAEVRALAEKLEDKAGDVSGN